MDEAAMIDLLERGVEPAAPGPGLAALRARSRQRRRRHRALAGAGSLVVVGGLAIAALGLGADDGARDRVVTTAPTDPTTTSVVVPDRPPAFTVSALPTAMATQGCQVLEPARDLRSCSFEVPTAPLPTQVHLAYVPGSATPEVRSAWEARDGARVEDLLGWGFEGDPTFGALGGVPVIAFGESDRVDGSSLGLPDRVAFGYAALVGDTVVQINSEASQEVLGELLAGLGDAPRWSALDGVLDLLPPGAEVLDQGVRSRWSDPQPMRPDLATPPPGRSYGASILVPPDPLRPLSIEVIEDLDATAFVDGLRSTAGTPYPSDEVEGRRAVRIPRDARPDRATAAIPRWGPQLLVVVDDRTLLSVTASSAASQPYVDAVTRQVLGNLE